MTDDVGEHEEVAEESLQKAEGDGVARIPTSMSLVPRRLELLPFPFQRFAIVHASSLGLLIHQSTKGKDYTELLVNPLSFHTWTDGTLCTIDRFTAERQRLLNILGRKTKTNAFGLS